MFHSVILKKISLLSLTFILMACSPAVTKTPAVLVSSPTSTLMPESLPTGTPIVETIGILPADTIEGYVSHTAESAGGSVKTDALRERNLARIVSEGSVLSMEDKSSDLVYLPYLEQPINADLNGVMTSYNFDHVADGFAYYSSGSEMIKTPIRMPAIEGKELVAVANFGAGGRGEVGVAVLDSATGAIDQLFLGLVFGGKDEVSISNVTEGYQISVKNEQGSFTLKDTASGEWDLVEKVYTSCADLELIEQTVFPTFEKLTGYTPKEALDYFIANGKFTQGVGYDKENSMYKNDLMSLGTAYVSMEQLPGALPGDGILCGYGLWDSAMADNLALPEDVAPIVLAFVYKGQYYPMAAMVEGEDFPGGTYNTVSSMVNMKSWAATHFLPGSDVHVDLLTFAGMQSVSEVTNEDQHGYLDNLALFMSLFGKDYFERMSALEIPSPSVGQALRPDLGDPGLVARFLKIKASAVLPKK